MHEASFDRFAGLSGILVGIGGLLYAGLFVWIVAGAPEAVRDLWFLTLLLGGLLTTVVLVGVYGWLREAEGELALWAMILGLAAALGGVLHGAYQMGVSLNPALGVAAGDPEAVSGGILRYGLGGVGLFVLGGLIARNPRFPRRLGLLGMVGGILLILTYVGRLIGVIEPAQRLTLIVPVLYGLVVHPVFYVWLGTTLRRKAPGTLDSERPAPVGRSS